MTSSSSSPSSSSNSNSRTDTSNPSTSSEKSTSSYIKHWNDMIHNCVDWMKNKIRSTLDLVLYPKINSNRISFLLLEQQQLHQQQQQQQTNSSWSSFESFESSSSMEIQLPLSELLPLIDSLSTPRLPSPFHGLPIDVIAGTLIRFIPMSDVGNLKLCSRACSELFEEAARKSSLLLLHSRPIQIGSYTSRRRYTLPTEPNSSYLPILWTLRHFISLISKQTETINIDYMTSHQGISVLGHHQYLDEHMRSSVIDWMIEVSVEFKFVPSILHYSVLLLDQVLSHVAIPRRYFQLLGCACLYTVSRPTNNTIQMDLDDVMYMCDSQYTLEEVNGMINFIDRHLDAHSKHLLSPAYNHHQELNQQQHQDYQQQQQQLLNQMQNSSSSSSSSFNMAIQTASSTTSSSMNQGNSSPLPIYTPNLSLPSFQITLNSPTMIHFLASICNALHLPLVMYQCIEINSSVYNALGSLTSSSEPTPTPSTSEHILLSIFLADLSLLDFEMLQYSPFTVACAIICLTRLTLYYYGQSHILLTPYGLADGKSREIKQLLKDDQHRLYILPDQDYLKKPFGLVWFEKFLLQSPLESQCIRSCVERLWLLHSDFIGYTYLATETSPYTPHILNFHTHIFAGLREKYAPHNSHRDAIWQKLQMLPRGMLLSHLNQIFPSRQQHSNTSTSTTTTTTSTTTPPPTPTTTITTTA